MAYNLIADFFGLVSVPTLNAFSVLLVICFIIWEIPRSIKIMDEEYTKGVYPEFGRVVDFALFVIGLIVLGYLSFNNTLERVVSFLKTPGITSFFLVVLVVIPLVILLGFFKRFFGRMEGNNSVTVFIVHGFLDLMHTLFYVSLAMLTLPSLGYLLFGPK